MSSTYSPDLRIQLLGSGDEAGTWGSTTNTTFAYLFESAIAGYQNVAIVSTSQALSYIYGASSTASDNQAVYAMLSFSGASAATAIYAPPVSKQYILKNDSSYTITIYNSTVIGNTTAAGTGAAIAAGTTVQVWSDGTNFYPVVSASSILSSAYPVGSIYINAAVATNPSTLLGFGTWTAFGTGRVLVGVDAGNAAFDTLGETGGSADAITVSHTHTATSVVTDPGHAHQMGAKDSTANEGGDQATEFVKPYPNIINPTSSTVTTGITVATTVASTGSSGTNANLQPYITVYMWRRTA
jgi:hypothetical protein